MCYNQNSKQIKKDMSNTIQLSKFDKAVEKYRMKEKQVSKNFLTGILELGAILKKEREIWKPQMMWTDYLEKIGRSMAGANQFIRLYEYSENHSKELYRLDLTNWHRINMFLTLPDNLKAKLAQMGDEDKNFEEKFEDVKMEELDDLDMDIQEEVDAKTAYTRMVENIKQATQVTFENFDQLVERTLDVGMQADPTRITKHSFDALKSELLMKSATKALSSKKHTRYMKPKEKAFWIKELRESRKMLNEALREFEK